MARPILLLGLVVGLGWANPMHASEELKIIFSADEYRQAGLDKLSPAEQAALLRALQERGLGRIPAGEPDRSQRAPVAAAKPNDLPPEKKSLWVRIKDFGAEQLPLKNNKDEGEVTEVDAQMAEPFAGLDGKTRFVLDNGQIWQQRAGESYYLGKPIPNPKVTIMRTRFGYRLKIPAVGAGFDVAIKRIK